MQARKQASESRSGKKASSAATAARGKAKSSAARKATSSKPAEESAKTDAGALLKKDHRKVEALFAQYESQQSVQEKYETARQICTELIYHTQIEEELFYPACRAQGVEDAMLDEAQVEHDAAKILIAELLSGDPSSAYYDAKVAVLREQIKHHVREEEQPKDGIIAKASAAGVDMRMKTTRA